VTFELALRRVRITGVRAHRDLRVPQGARAPCNSFDAARRSWIERIASETAAHASFELTCVDAACRPL
jgi:hypothetical protein